MNLSMKAFDKCEKVKICLRRESYTDERNESKNGQAVLNTYGVWRVWVAQSV